MNEYADYVLDYDTPVAPELQANLDAIDIRLRAQHGMSPEHSAIGLLDLKGLRLAMLHPDRLEYAASVPKIGILLAYFQLYPAAVTDLAVETRHQLGQMIKASSNEMATRFSRQLGLKQIQQVLNDHGFYEPARGGGIWMGKHYGANDERIGDPLGDHSHAATVRQLLRFYLLLEQGRLVSPQASCVMRQIFDSPDIPHDNNKFVAGLAGRNLRIRRKSGFWGDWQHDTAMITGPDRRYILVALTHHAQGGQYLGGLARAADDLMTS